MKESVEDIARLSCPECEQRGRMLDLEGYRETGDLYRAMIGRDRESRLVLAGKIVALTGN
jgi:hypothetical protein